MTPHRMFAAIVCTLLSTSAAAQDAASARPTVFTVEIENQWVRVLRLKLEPRAVTGVHVHPESIAVLLTDVHARVMNADADGNVTDVNQQAGQVLFRQSTCRRGQSSGWKKFLVTNRATFRPSLDPSSCE